MTPEQEVQKILASTPCRHRKSLWKHALQFVEVEGLWLEFGVSKGTSLDFLSRNAPGGVMYGFDTFQGLPEDWDLGDSVKPKGTFKGKPIGKAPTATLITGLFEDSLPGFVEDYTDQVALLHIDSDLYASCVTVFNYLEERLVPGTVIIFDEIYNYPNYAKDEMKAWLEMLERFPVHEYRWLGHVPKKSAAALQITGWST